MPRDQFSAGKSTIFSVDNSLGAGDESEIG